LKETVNEIQALRKEQSKLKEEYHEQGPRRKTELKERAGKDHEGKKGGETSEEE